VIKKRLIDKINGKKMRNLANGTLRRKTLKGFYDEMKRLIFTSFFYPKSGFNH